MTAKTSLIGAFPTCKAKSWENIPVKTAKKHVFRLQMRIAKAAREGKNGRVKALQRILTHSFYGKYLSVKQVTSNTGKYTSGVDGKIWGTNLQKIRAIESLKRRGYKPSPLKRIYIPKNQDSKQKRPLSIPTMKDRAMQALWLLALIPIAENLADRNSYGFRTMRSAQDAIEQCFINFGKKGSCRICFGRRYKVLF